MDVGTLEVVHPRLGGFCHLERGTFASPRRAEKGSPCCGKRSLILLMVQKSGDQPVEVGRLSHYLQGFINPRWLFRNSEPLTVCLGEM